MKLASLWFTALAVVLITGLAQAGTVYQWTDENGVRHFSNTAPPENATRVSITAETISPSAAEAPAESPADQEQDETLSGPAVQNQTASPSDPPAEGTTTPTVQERAKQLERERMARQTEEERRRLEAEIVQVEQRSLSRTFTEGMRAARLDPLKQQLALLDADPNAYFRMKREGAFAPGREQSSNRSLSERRRSLEQMRP